jgi:predicted MPP superfamily phosphohydrolase
MFDVAADNGYRLYLCGHTHGGQICLPGGIPIILHLRHGRRYYRGLWHYGRMTGYTGQGAGTVGLPVRFNTQSEITVLRLVRRQYSA